MNKVGKIVKLQHFTHNGKFKKSSRPVYANIVMEYADGDVQVENSHEVWQVRPSKDPKAQFETFAVVVDEA
jgi:hypothetical protein